MSLSGLEAIHLILYFLFAVLASVLIYFVRGDVRLLPSLWLRIRSHEKLSILCCTQLESESSKNEVLSNEDNRNSDANFKGTTELRKEGEYSNTNADDLSSNNEDSQENEKNSDNERDGATSRKGGALSQCSNVSATSVSLFVFLGLSGIVILLPIIYLIIVVCGLSENQSILCTLTLGLALYFFSWGAIGFLTNVYTISKSFSWTFYVSFGCLFLFLCFWITLSEIFSVIGTSSILATISLLPLILAYLSYEIDDTYGPHPTKMAKDLGLAELLHFQPFRIALGLKSKQETIGTLYLISLIVLLINAILISCLSSDAKAIGWVSFAVIGVCEYTVYAMRDIILPRAFSIDVPFIVLLSVCVARILVVSFGSYYWFLGHCFLFLLIMTPLGIVYVSQTVQISFGYENAESSIKILDKAREDINNKLGPDSMDENTGIAISTEVKSSRKENSFNDIPLDSPEHKPSKNRNGNGEQSPVQSSGSESRPGSFGSSRGNIDGRDFDEEHLPEGTMTMSSIEKEEKTHENSSSKERVSMISYLYAMGNSVSNFVEDYIYIWIDKPYRICVPPFLLCVLFLLDLVLALTCPAGISVHQVNGVKQGYYGIMTILLLINSATLVFLIESEKYSSRKKSSESILLNQIEEGQKKDLRSTAERMKERRKKEFPKYLFSFFYLLSAFMATYLSRDWSTLVGLVLFAVSFVYFNEGIKAWVKQDYHLEYIYKVSKDSPKQNGVFPSSSKHDRDEGSNRNEHEEGEGSTFSKFVSATVATVKSIYEFLLKAWKSLNPILRDWMISFICAVLMAILLPVIILEENEELHHSDYAWIGFSFPMWLMLLSSIYLLHKKWNNTLTLSIALYVYIAYELTVLLTWVLVFWLVFLKDQKATYTALIILFICCELPSFQSLYAARQLKIDNNGIMSLTSKFFLLTGILLQLLFCILLCVFVSVGAGIMLIIFITCLIVGGYVFLKAQENYFHVSKTSKLIILCLGVVLILASVIAAFIMEAETSYYVYSTGWIVIAFLMLCLGISSNLRYHSQVSLSRFYTTSFFPVYKWKLENKSVSYANRGPFLVIFALGMILIWGLLGGIIMTSQTGFIGIWFAAVSAIISLLYVVFYLACQYNRFAYRLIFANENDMKIALRNAVEKELESQISVGQGTPPSPSTAERLRDYTFQNDLALYLENRELLRQVKRNQSETNIRLLFSGGKANTPTDTQDQTPDPVTNNNHLGVRSSIIKLAASISDTVSSANLDKKQNLLTHSRIKMERAMVHFNIALSMMIEGKRIEFENNLTRFLRVEIQLSPEAIEHFKKSPIEMRSLAYRFKSYEENRAWEIAEAQRLRQREEEENRQREEERRRKRAEEDRRRMEEQARQREEEERRRREEEEEAARRRAADQAQREALELEMKQREEERRRAEVFKWNYKVSTDNAVDWDKADEKRLIECVAKIRNGDNLKGLFDVYKTDEEGNSYISIDQDKVKLHLEECGGRFLDPEFPPIESSMDNDEELGVKSHTVWERASKCNAHLNTNNQGLPQDGASFDDICQGLLGDCWFLSAMSCVSLKDKEKGLLRNIFVSANTNLGYYIVKVYKDGMWREVLIDDYFPVHGNNLYTVPYLYARTRRDDQVWVQVLEKAYSKLHGSYKDIEGGFIEEAMCDLTAGSGSTKKFKQGDADIIDGSIWHDLVTWNTSGHLLGASSPTDAGSDDVKSSGGIVQSHAYSILDVREVDGHKLLKMRNPWGEGEWQGAWSDGSSNWTTRMKKLLDYKNVDDGIFWMSFADFTTEFSKIYICRIFDKTRYHRCEQKGEWKGITAGGQNYYETSCNNPHYALTVQSPGVVYIYLEQGDDRGEEEEKEKRCIQIALLDTGGKRLDSRYSPQKDVVKESGFSWNRASIMEVDLSTKTYTIQVATLRPNEANSFVLKCYSESNIELSPI